MKVSNNIEGISEMTIHKIVTKNKSDNHVIAMRDFAGLKFTIFTYFCFGTFLWSSRVRVLKGESVLGSD